MSNADRIEELRSKYEENPRRYFAPLANEFRKAGDLAQAIAICREHLPKQPGHMSGYIVFGQTLYEANSLDEARAVFEQALSLDPENLIALKHLGDIARTKGENAVARRWYERVLDADPRNDDIAAQLASLSIPTPPIAMPAIPAVPVPDAGTTTVPEPEPNGVFATYDPGATLDVSDAAIVAPRADWEPRPVASPRPTPVHEPIDLDFPDDPGPVGAIDLEEQFEEGIIAPEWPDTTELVNRVTSPVRPTPSATVPVSEEARDAFGRERHETPVTPVAAISPVARATPAAPAAPIVPTPAFTSFADELIDFNMPLLTAPPPSTAVSLAATPGTPAAQQPPVAEQPVAAHPIDALAELIDIGMPTGVLAASSVETIPELHDASAATAHDSPDRTPAESVVVAELAEHEPTISVDVPHAHTAQTVQVDDEPVESFADFVGATRAPVLQSHQAPVPEESFSDIANELFSSDAPSASADELPSIAAFAEPVAPASEHGREHVSGHASAHMSESALDVDTLTVALHDAAVDELPPSIAEPEPVYTSLASFAAASFASDEEEAAAEPKVAAAEEAPEVPFGAFEAVMTRASLVEEEPIVETHAVAAVDSLFAEIAPPAPDTYVAPLAATEATAEVETAAVDSASLVDEDVSIVAEAKAVEPIHVEALHIAHATDAEAEAETVDDDEPDAAFVTETMAELLVAQGFVARAIDIYEELVRRRGDEPTLAARLAELRDQQAATKQLQAERKSADGARATPTAPAGTPVVDVATTQFSTPVWNTPIRNTPLNAPVYVTPHSLTPVANVAHSSTPSVAAALGALATAVTPRRVTPLAPAVVRADQALFRTAREQFAELALRRVPRRTPIHATAVPDDPADGLSSLFGNARPTSHDEVAARALADAFGPVQDTGESLFDAPSSAAELAPSSYTPHASPVTHAASALAAEPRVERSSSPDYSFDRFFPDPAVASNSMSATAFPPSAPATSDTSTEDLAQFSAWLKGLNST